MILEKRGLSDVQIERRRPYSYGTIGLAKITHGSLIDEFLDRADSVVPGGELLHTPVGTIDTVKELEIAEREFNEALATEPWVQAKAKENLRAAGQLPIQADVDAEARRISTDYRAETESHRALMRGLETWIGTVPLIGPGYSVVDGIRHRNFWEVVTGAIFLGMDTFDLIGGDTPNVDTAPAVRGTMPNLAPHERVTVNSINHALDELDIARQHFAAHAKGARIDQDPMRIAMQDANVPAAYRDLAERVRNGEVGVTWESHELVYLQNEDRVVPVRHQGGTYQEIDWKTGKRVPASRLIHRDGGRYYTDLGLKGGQPPAEREVMGTKLSERHTVEQVTDIMREAKNLGDRGFRRAFERHFKLSREENASDFEAENFYHALYIESPTFRRLFNHALDQMPDSEGPEWEIAVGRGLRARTNFNNRVIQIPSDAELLAKRYVGVDGFKPVRLEQAYLHEMIHALTLKLDPLGTSGLRHRGPIVYLTDKILSEAGYDIPEQVMYRRPSDFASHRSEADEDLQSRGLSAAEAAAEENKYLDSIVDRDRPIDRETSVLGQLIETRETVRTIQALLKQMELTPLTYVSESVYYQGFNQHFSISPESGEMRMVRFEELRLFYAELFSKSETFRLLTRRWRTKQLRAEQLEQWDFVLHGRAMVSESLGAPRMYVIDERAHTIQVETDGSMYLSDDGLRTVEFDRRLTRAMVQLMTRAEEPAAPVAYRNRGAGVFLTDKILHEAGYSYPRQIADELAAPADEAAKNRLWVAHTNVRRAADIEDRYLDKTLEASCRLFASCVGE